MFSMTPLTIGHTMRAATIGALGTDPVRPERRSRRARRTPARQARPTATLRRSPALLRRAG
jgi:hypothetical protein